MKPEIVENLFVSLTNDVQEIGKFLVHTIVSYPSGIRGIVPVEKAKYSQGYGWGIGTDMQVMK